VIETQGLGKVYGRGLYALRDLTLTIEKGEFVFLTGPSGAGKSTLLRLLLLQERPSEGDVIVGGRNLARLTRDEVQAYRRTVGFVFQDFKLIATKTVFENVSFALRVLGMPVEQQRRRTYQVLKWVGLQHRLNSIPEEDRLLARRSVFVGVAMAEREGEADKPYDGGYVVRNIMGVDPTRGIVRVGHQFHEGQTIRLQVRDARTAEQELVGLLERYKREHEVMPGAAAFMFQCNGRGTNLFGEEGHDARVFRAGLGAMPLAGFFCNGEIGPVGEVTYIHGYTSSIGILRPRLS